MKNIANLAVALLLATASFAADVPAPAPPAEGTAAPTFKLPSQDSPSVSLDQFKGKWVVLYFYPKDFTSGCTLEAHNFQRDLPKYEAKNAVIVGVSEDNVESHKGFCTKEGLSFKVLADTTEHSVATNYRSVVMHGGPAAAARNTFLIGPNGVIPKVYRKAKPATRSDEALADLDTLQAKK